MKIYVPLLITGCASKEVRARAAAIKQLLSNQWDEVLTQQDYEQKKREYYGNVASSEPNIDTLIPNIDNLAASANECHRRLQVAAEELGAAIYKLKNTTTKLSESLGALSAAIAEAHVNISAK